MWLASQVQDYSLGSKDNSTDYKRIELCILQEFRFRSFSFNILVCCDIISSFDISSISFFWYPLLSNLYGQKGTSHQPWVTTALSPRKISLRKPSSASYRVDLPPQRPTPVVRSKSFGRRLPRAGGRGNLGHRICFYFRMLDLLKRVKVKCDLRVERWGEIVWVCTLYLKCFFFLMRRYYSGKKWKNI